MQPKGSMDGLPGMVPFAGDLGGSHAPRVAVAALALDGASAMVVEGGVAGAPLRLELCLSMHLHAGGVVGIDRNVLSTLVFASRLLASALRRNRPDMVAQLS